MKDWHKGVIVGLFIGTFGLVPLIFWLVEIRAKFRCPNCNAKVRVQKGHKFIIPEVLGEHAVTDWNDSDRESRETSQTAVADSLSV